eukprot:CAMPEP_0202694888 /NCGR_PEP_ID=MMETSP1385-20130828/8620_1 /ASSEMBLY_ACC=CAM_ASM_000861 /TAXON_ID=933848 /ORGANISM="Elphidium margaritaceum" /LENGTH=359 /DNA_ID=CAMNT_0049350817 /DNA_START=39 /DNA_END=1118 /DNA_ORIENTATION=-
MATISASRNPHTITRYILQEQQKYPNAKGDLSIILNAMTLSCKIISAAAKGAGIFQRVNVGRLKHEFVDLPNDSNYHVKGAPTAEQDEKAHAHDDIRKFGYDTIYSSVSWCGKIPTLLSTYDTTTAIKVGQCDEAKYVLVFDPIDGKKNIQINASLGTIFGVYKVVTTGKPSDADLKQAGNQLVAAGYALYGDATLVVISFGDEVNGFTLDPTIGEFVLTHKNLRIPEVGGTYSINEGYAEDWNAAIKEYVVQCKKSSKDKKASRYIGCMVADVHRALIKGGIYLYPENKKFPNGKLSLQCECNPLAFIIAAAGGRASNGKQSILDIVPKSSADTTPIFIGSKQDVIAVEEAYKRHNIK